MVANLGLSLKKSNTPPDAVAHVLPHGSKTVVDLGREVGLHYSLEE